MKKRLACLVFGIAAVLSATPLRGTEPGPTSVAFLVDASAGAPAQHGVEALRAALGARGLRVTTAADIETVDAPLLVVVGLAAPGSPAAQLLQAAGEKPPATAEALVIKHFAVRGRAALVVCGTDDRGLMYALLDTAERVGWAKDSSKPFSEVRDATEQPYTRERSISAYTMNRAYWESRFYDERYWTRYFDTLAANRFNKFLIVFGYENGGFLAPCYPYFFDTPGFPNVHMRDLTPEQQRKNFAAMNRLIELAHARGIAVAVGIWDHVYRAGVQTGGNEWEKDFTGAGKPVPNSVAGVTTENLNAYTLASLEKFLSAFPGLDEVQFRIHEESGLKREEMDGFWREVFTMTRRVRPTLLFEARAKGTPDSVINTALALGVNLRVETKYWMEQMGLPFHPTHTNKPDQMNRRHGYADLLRFPKRYDMNWRLWNGGTSRVLLWADPEYVARYSASAQLYDSPNWDVNEPLATKMEAQRPDMNPFELMPEKYRYYDYEFERYWHFFQVWGRVGYNPSVSPEVWQHEFTRRFGPAAASHLEAGLHRASQVLPMLVASACYPYSGFPTTRGWAERQSLGASLDAYAKNTGTDVQQFESFDEAAQRILAGGTTTKRTPDATSRWLDETADAVLAEVRAAEVAQASLPAAEKSRLESLRSKNEFDSTITDLKILAQLARFHARRSIAAVHYNLFKRGQRIAELLAATLTEKEAVAAWRELVAIAGDRYTFDLAMGARNYSLCGHWRDELAKLASDLSYLESQCCPPEEAVAKETVWRPAMGGDHTPPHVEHSRITTTRPGEPLHVVARITDPSGVATVRLRYRHLTQYEDYLSLEMTPTGTAGEFAATVPGDFLVSHWDFMYFLEATDRAGNGTMWPDLLKEQPYVIVKLQRGSP